MIVLVALIVSLRHGGLNELSKVEVAAAPKAAQMVLAMRISYSTNVDELYFEKKKSAIQAFMCRVLLYYLPL